MRAASELAGGRLGLPLAREDLLDKAEEPVRDAVTEGLVLTERAHAARQSVRGFDPRGVRPFLVPRARERPTGAKGSERRTCSAQWSAPLITSMRRFPPGKSLAMRLGSLIAGGSAGSFSAGRSRAGMCAGKVAATWDACSSRAETVRLRYQLSGACMPCFLNVSM